MTETKTILLIGRSGRGKSTLANVITNTNNFKESSGSVSETKKNQFEKFEDVSNKINYAIIDTPGIGDTKMSDSEVLDIIAEAVYLAKDGISQVFFVNDGRFDQHEMATYDLLRTIIFDENITKHTTIVRTRFADFKKSKKCQADIDLMAKEAQAKKTELEKNIADKEGGIKSLSPGSEQYQKMLNELEKAKKELTATNLAEIIESCQGRIVYVDNPSIIIDAADNEDENKKKRREKLMNLNEKARNKSREILLEHLSKVSQGEPYNPANLKELSQEIADDYFQYLKKKEELQKELDEEMKKLSSKISQSSVALQTSSGQSSSIDIPILKDSQTELELGEERQAKVEEKVLIIEKKEHDQIIAELQDKKARLKKEIAEKEKIIHQKVLKHIFNNYEAINKELGGNIFLNSVAGEHP
ncbi:8620_t:CDS:1 [Funneliformis geosporum]|nr:8620_t:CDS:1 [Funneliformis geosporum]